ncbi:L,D-transpeptidase [uncultured Rhodoblastus sp.]|uniref:L,D-transpeptidase n=1 Tax=uncultured Rhodoblastus sp. TaxID=543037 RepID=UPI0025CE4C09|nr:L,D-transpeptidase [uncultured Rhodoblastus sp.]
MRKLVQFLVVVLALFSAPLAARAKVRITVDLSSQQMDVLSDSGSSYSWPISSARSGYVTPRGVYSAVSLQTMHRSKKYHNSPMPHSIFFHGGYAIHGTYETASLGRPASHGCVRISPANAAMLFSLVRAEGATIEIVGSPPPSHPFASESRHRRHYALAHHKHYARSGHGHRATALSYAPERRGDFPTRVFGYVLH